MRELCEYFLQEVLQIAIEVCANREGELHAITKLKNDLDGVGSSGSGGSSGSSRSGNNLSSSSSHVEPQSESGRKRNLDDANDSQQHTTKALRTMTSSKVGTGSKPTNEEKSVNVKTSIAELLAQKNKLWYTVIPQGK